METTTAPATTVARAGAARARIRFEHGGGQLVVRAGADPDLLLTADVGEHARADVRRDGDRADVVVRPVGTDWRRLIDPATWRGPHRPFDWDVRLNPTVPLVIEVATGASKNTLDLSGLRAARVVLDTGMSDTDLTLPAAAGFTTVEVHSGLADVTIRVPPGVAASIRGSVGLGSLSVDQTRFPPTADGFESPDYATAPNRAELRVDGGLESVKVL
jgi:hypothetical protein